MDSGIPMINIQEFIFHTSPQKRIVRKNICAERVHSIVAIVCLTICSSDPQEASFWFKYALKYYESVDPNNIERCLITLGVFCSNYNDVRTKTLCRLY